LFAPAFQAGSTARQIGLDLFIGISQSEPGKFPKQLDRLDLLPGIGQVRVLRQWAGTCDMTPDFSPIIGSVPSVQGFILDVGWGTYGFKAGPIAGKLNAELIASGKIPELAQPFGYTRFLENRLSGEKAAAATSH